MRRLSLLTVLLLPACLTFEPAHTHEQALVELDPKDFPDFADDLDYADLDAAIANSIEYYSRVVKDEPTATIPFGAEQVPVAKVAQSLEAFRALIARKPGAAELRAALASRFRVFQSTGGDRDRNVLVTGYYLPEVHGAWHAEDTFNVPVYGPPPDLVTAHAADYPQLDADDLVGTLSGKTLQPLPTRAEIAAGALKGKNLELLWLDSALDEYFLEIQGSGLVKFRDGSTRVLTFAGRNGRKYFPIGRELVKRGALKKEDLSMQTIRAWLDAHPADQDTILNMNESKVFFRISPHAEGSIGTPITPQRTIATDIRVFPKGALAFIETDRPESVTSDKWRHFSRFVVDQDAGGAVRTAGHVDLFWGSGDYAAVAAGRMKQPGKLYYLLTR